MKLLVEGGAAAQELALLRRAAEAAQATEGISLPCVAQLQLVDDAQMRAINLSQRGVDSGTDVLSFPGISYPHGGTAGQCPELLMQEWDTAEAACYMGDILLSLPRARQQAIEYGHSSERELAYLLVHAAFHLFGYDHLNEEDKRSMRDKEELAMRRLDLTQDTSDTALRQRALEAMAKAYVPYSRFKVGACLLAEDGSVYTGCNVENVSFGLTNCAERTAVFKAVSEGSKAFTAIAIAAEDFAPWPCGACRQVLSEFAPDIRVLLTWGDGETAESTLGELLPHSFSPSSGAEHAIKGGQDG